MTDAPTGETLSQRRARIAMLRRLNSALPKEQRRAIPPLHEPAHTGPDRAPEATIDFLLAMSRSNYMDLVCGDLAADKDDRWALYLDPRLIQLTHSVLIRKRSAAARLTRETRESAESEVGRRRWRFIEMLESRIQQVEAALPDAVLTSDRHTTRRLFAAIHAHRRALVANGVEPEAWDLKLWQAADELSDPTSGADEPGGPDAPTPVL
jgi:hypothetical protein